MITPVCEMLGIERPIVQAPMAAVPRWPRRSRMPARSAW